MRQIKCQVASCYSEIDRITSFKKSEGEERLHYWKQLLVLSIFHYYKRTCYVLSSCQNYGCAINTCSEEEHLKLSLDSNEEFSFSAQISTLGHSRRSRGRCPIWPFIGETRGPRPRRV